MKPSGEERPPGGGTQGFLSFKISSAGHGSYKVFSRRRHPQHGLRFNELHIQGGMIINGKLLQARCGGWKMVRKEDQYGGFCDGPIRHI